MKIKETQVTRLKEAGLWEGFIDSLKHTIKKLTDKDIQRITKKHNKQVGQFLKDFKKNPEKFGY